MQPKRNAPAGIRVRHSSYCPSRDGGDCTAGRKGGCRPAYEAFVFDPRTKTKRRKTFPTMAAAKGWRVDGLSASQRGQLATPSKVTLREAWDDWYERATAEPPLVLARGGGHPFKPSVLRTYESHMRNYVLPELGAYKLSDLTHAHLLDLAEQVRGNGLSASTVRNIVMPIRAVFRREQARNRTLANPTTGLELPSALGRRERAVGIDEAELLIGLLPESERPLWACAFFSGLRRGELQALRWSDVDFAKGLIHVERSWDAVAGYIEPKSAKGTRAVPIMGALHDYLAGHKARTRRDGDDLVFGSTVSHPFTATNVRRKALAAWEAANKKRAADKLDPVQPVALHELRHSCVTFMHEAGLSLEEIGDLVGHSSTYMSDRYRHLRDDRRDQLAAKLDAYAELSATAARIEQLETDED